MTLSEKIISDLLQTKEEEQYPINLERKWADRVVPFAKGFYLPKIPKNWEKVLDIILEIIHEKDGRSRIYMIKFEDNKWQFEMSYDPTVKDQLEPEIEKILDHMKLEVKPERLLEND